MTGAGLVSCTVAAVSQRLTQLKTCISKFEFVGLVCELVIVAVFVLASSGAPLQTTEECCRCCGRSQLQIVVP